MACGLDTYQREDIESSRCSGTPEGIPAMAMSDSRSFAFYSPVKNSALEGWIVKRGKRRTIRVPSGAAMDRGKADQKSNQENSV